MSRLVMLHDGERLNKQSTVIANEDNLDRLMDQPSAGEQRSHT